MFPATLFPPSCHLPDSIYYCTSWKNQVYTQLHAQSQRNRNRTKKPHREVWPGEIRSAALSIKRAGNMKAEKTLILLTLFQIKHIWHIWLLLSTGIRRYKRKADMTHICIIARTEGKFYLLLGWRQNTSFFIITVRTSHSLNPLITSEPVWGGLRNGLLAGK